MSGQSKMYGRVDIIGSPEGLTISPCLLNKTDCK